jgi:methionyl-tRNA formyltransferase
MSDNKILVLSDNLEMLKEFQQRGKEFSDYEFIYAFSPGNLNAKKFTEIGCLEIDVSKNLTFILNNFNKIFSVHCKQIFPKELVDQKSCFNLHPGLNPINRGWAPQTFSILNNTPLGATLHQMSKEIDAGPIIAQIEVKVEEWDTSSTAYTKVLQAEKQILDQSLDKVLNGRFFSKEPKERGNYNSQKDFLNLFELDLDTVSTYRSFINHLRATSHPPYLNTFFLSKEGAKVFVKIELIKSED